MSLNLLKTIIQFFFQHFFKALGWTIIFFGSSHLIVSYIMMVLKDYNEGNLFRILNYQKIFPGIDYGLDSFIISNILAVAGFFVAFGLVVLVEHRNNRKAAANATVAAEAEPAKVKTSSKPRKKSK